MLSNSLRANNMERLKHIVLEKKKDELDEEARLIITNMDKELRNISFCSRTMSDLVMNGERGEMLRKEDKQISNPNIYNMLDHEYTRFLDGRGRFKLFIAPEYHNAFIVFANGRLPKSIRVKLVDGFVELYDPNNPDK